MQKLEKIFPNISSLLISPVISPTESITFLKSIESKSPGTSFSIASLTFSIEVIESSLKVFF